jgi:Cys-tRNA(Pro)/Cys-tRNA(Cys) deacylase
VRGDKKTRDSTPALRAAREAGVPHRVHEFTLRDDAGTEAFPAALGVAPERVFKTLIAELQGGALAVAVVPLPLQLDLKALAAAAGVRSAAMADPRAAERATGYRVGGISPLGQKRRLPVFLDASARAFETVFVSAGRWGLELELAADDLVRVCGAEVVQLAR